MASDLDQIVLVSVKYFLINKVDKSAQLASCYILLRNLSSLKEVFVAENLAPLLHHVDLFQVIFRLILGEGINHSLHGPVKFDEERYQRVF